MRADRYLVEKDFFKSRTKAAESIERGEIFIDGKRCSKASQEITDGAKIEIKADLKPFVSLGGYKLEKAINILNPEISDKTFIDAGASTGGFTDCLLRRGAKKVYCVDVGENLLDKTIAINDKVIVMDKTNVRYLTKENFEENVDGVVADCSFISLEYVLPPLIPLIKENGFILALIKPQFELNERKSLKNGILKDEKERVKVIKRLYDFSVGCGLFPQKIVNITTDKKKNKEYIFYLKKQGNIVNFCNILIDEDK